MTNIYVVSIESHGDGSNNWGDNNRPGITVYTNLDHLYSALEKYLCQEKLNLNQKLFQDIIRQGGVTLDDDLQIRVNSDLLNPEMLNQDHGCHWKLPNKAKSFNELVADLPNEDQIRDAFASADMEKINQYLDWSLDVLNIGLKIAAASGKLELVKFLLNMGAKDWIEAVEEAADNKQHEVVKFLVKSRAQTSSVDIFDILSDNLADAFCEADINVIDQYLELGFNNWNLGFMSASAGGHLNLIKKMLDKGANDWVNAIEAATYGGHVEVLEFLFGHMPVETQINWSTLVRPACSDLRVAKIVFDKLPLGVTNIDWEYVIYVSRKNPELLAVIFSKLPSLNNIKWELHLRWLLVWEYHDAFKFLLDKTPTEIKLDWSSLALVAKTSDVRLLILDCMPKN